MFLATFSLARGVSKAMPDSRSDEGVGVERYSPAAAFDPISLIRYVPETSSSVLDCACGDGARGKRLKQRPGRVVIGVERHPEKATLAEQHLDDVLCGEFATLALPFSEGQFDCILCDGVMAQVPDPFVLLEKCFVGSPM